MTLNRQNDMLTALSVKLEACLVARNPRGMARVREALEPGYLYRAAKLLAHPSGDVLICTGFPVADTFETDGPAGALALYEHCERLGLRPWLLAGEPLIAALGGMARGLTLNTFDVREAREAAERLLEGIAPVLIIVIERPGAAADGRYYNIRGVDITELCRPAEPYIQLASCPVVAIGDGGNEIGMAKAGDILTTLNIKPATSSCDELIVADVSNWGAYGLIAMSEYINDMTVLSQFDPTPLLERLIEVGAVDGVTHQTTPTEDGLDATAGPLIVETIQELCAQTSTQRVSMQ